MIFPLKNNKHSILYFRTFNKKRIVFPKENYNLIMKDGTVRSKEILKEMLDERKNF